MGRRHLSRPRRRPGPGPAGRYTRAGSPSSRRHHVKIVVDYDECASNAVCMGIAPEVFEVRDDGFLYVLERAPGRGAAREGPPGGQRLPHRCHHHRRGRVTGECRGPPRGSASPRRPRATSTSAAPARRCSTGWWPASRAAPSCCASRTPTPSGAARSGWTGSSRPCTGWGWTPTRVRTASRCAPIATTRPSTPCGRPGISTPATAPARRSMPATRRPGS